MKIKVMIVLCSVAVLISGCATAQRPSAWEYKTVSGQLESSRSFSQQKPLTLAEQINEAAAEGWEVVSAGCEGENNRPFALLRKRK